MILYSHVHSRIQAYFVAYGMYIVLWCDANTSPAIKYASARDLHIVCLTDQVAGKPAYRTADKHRRCLNPVDGFQERNIINGYKPPHNIRMCDDDVFVLTGLWVCGNDLLATTVPLPVSGAPPSVLDIGAILSD